MQPSAGRFSRSTRTPTRTRAPTTAYDVGFSARIRGGNIYGGTSIGRQLTSSCEVDDPNSLRYCDLSELDIPYSAQFKLAGSYPLPYDIQLSGSWQGYPGTVGGTARQDSVYDPALNRIPDSSLNVNYNVTPADRPCVESDRRADTGQRHCAAAGARHEIP